MKDAATWLMRKGELAIRKLWAMANSEETPEPRRVELLKWFAEMGLGKAKVMDLQPAKAAGGGVVILPAVMPNPLAGDDDSGSGCLPLDLI